ncbi:MAG: DUF547 domain-containing protein [Planctomycetes bacterium]|nr:DUF547 domain-containing protein [Planctomycetota bacterium]
MKKRTIPAAAVVAAATVLLGGFIALPLDSRRLLYAEAERAGTGREFTYEGYVKALKAYVDDRGLVDYKGLKENIEVLHAFFDELRGLDPKVLAKWTDKEKIAFWINAYNAYTLKCIALHYPIKPTFPARLKYPKNSIRQIRGVWTILEFPIIGTRMTLDEMEHKRLRKKFNEPRIHMALVCAAISCPPLRNERYVAETLDEQFDDQTRRFLARRGNFYIDREDNIVHMSSTFKWFGKDFVKTYGTDEEFAGHRERQRAVLKFISGYLEDEDRLYLAEKKYKIRYLDYDWTLNEQPAEKAAAE